MAISQTELGLRLKQAREASGMTQEQVAQEVGISRPAVAQIEGGHRAVSSLELDRLAYLYGRDMRHFFAPEFGTDNTLAGLFRSNEDLASDPSSVTALRRCLGVSRELTHLERLSGIEREPYATVRYNLPNPRSRYDAIRQGSAIAEQERRRLGMGKTPIRDVADLLEVHGVRTAVVDLPEDVSGLTLVDSEAGPFVAVNRREHVLRRNFSLAHEYGHVLFDCDSKGMISRSSERADLHEVRANSFAASLLMPAAGVRKALAVLGKGGESRLIAESPMDDEEVTAIEARDTAGRVEVKLHDVVLLAYYFAVSRQVTLYRLRNLKILSERQLNELMEQEQSGKGRQLELLLDLPEPEHSVQRNRFRHRFLSLALGAYQREAISRSKLEEIFATLLERPRADIALGEFGVVDDKTPAAPLLPD